MILDFIKIVLNINTTEDEWKRVRYPPNSKLLLFGRIPIRI